MYSAQFNFMNSTNLCLMWVIYVVQWESWHQKHELYYKHADNVVSAILPSLIPQQSHNSTLHTLIPHDLQTSNSTLLCVTLDLACDLSMDKCLNAKIIKNDHTCVLFQCTHCSGGHSSVVSTPTQQLKYDFCFSI